MKLSRVCSLSVFDIYNQLSDPSVISVSCTHLISWLAAANQIETTYDIRLVQLSVAH